MINKLYKHFSFNDLLLVGALLIAAGLVWNTIGAMQRNYRLQQKYDQLSSEVELLELQNKNLQYNIAYLKTDDFLELAARDKFNKSLPGETMVYLPGNSVAAQAPIAKTTEQAKVVEEKGWRANLKEWSRFFSGSGQQG